jgi:hypothetical protein
MFIVAFISFFVGCAGGQRLPEEGTPEAELYRQKCTVCHGLPSPKRHTKIEWTHYLSLMEYHMKNRGVLFPEDEKAMIHNYLQRNSR